MRKPRMHGIPRHLLRIHCNSWNRFTLASLPKSSAAFAELVFPKKAWPWYRCSREYVSSGNVYFNGK